MQHKHEDDRKPPPNMTTSTGIHICENASDSLNGRRFEMRFATNTTCPGASLVESLNPDDGDSVETAELVRRIRQPLECAPTSAVTMNRTNHLFVAPTSPSKCISFIAKNDSTPYCNRTEADHKFPPNIVEISIVEDTGLYNPDKAKVDDKCFPTGQCDDDFVLPEQCDDNFVLPEECDDDFVLPEECDDDFDLPEESDDDFVLPEQSDTSDDDSSNSDEVGKQARDTDVTCRATSQEQHCRTYTEAQLAVPNAGRQSKNIKGIEMVDEAQLSMPWPLSDSKDVAQSIENVAFGFSPNQLDSQGLNTSTNNALSRKHRQQNFAEYSFDFHRNTEKNCLQVSSAQNSGSGMKHAARLARKDGIEYEENIESFSDDEYSIAFGLGDASNVLMKRRPLPNRLDRAAYRHDQKALTQKCIDVSKGQFVLGRYPQIESLAEKNKSKLDLSYSSKNGKSSIDNDSRQIYYGNTEQSCQLTNRGLSSKDVVMHDVTNRQNINRPRRIRDPSARPVIVPHQLPKLTSAKQYRHNTNQASTLKNVPAPKPASARTTTWERNDVFGGSGVGAGSYQIQRQSNRESRTEAEDISVVVVDSSQDDIDATKKRRSVSKQRSFKKANAVIGSKVKGPKNSRGGKRGKWGWRNKGKRTTKEKGSASIQSRQRRVTNTWAGNTDDPQLRHVGGAEMSF